VVIYHPAARTTHHPIHHTASHYEDEEASLDHPEEEDEPVTLEKKAQAMEARKVPSTLELKPRTQAFLEAENTRDEDGMALMAAVAMAALSGKKTPVHTTEERTPPSPQPLLTQISPSSVMTTTEIKVDSAEGKIPADQSSPKRKYEVDEFTASRLPFKKRRALSNEGSIAKELAEESRNPSPVHQPREQVPLAPAEPPRRVSPTPNQPSHYEREHYARQGSSPQHHHQRYYAAQPSYDSPGYPKKVYQERAYPAQHGAHHPAYYRNHASPGGAPHYPPPYRPYGQHHSPSTYPHPHHPGRSHSSGRIPASPPQSYEQGHSPASTPMVPMYEELVRTSGLPKSLSFRKICSRCGKTRGEHGELGFGNKCVFQECGKCGAGLHVHQNASQPMGILCQLTVEEGATAGAARMYVRKIKDLAARAELQKEMQRRRLPAEGHSGMGIIRREAAVEKVE
jgi:hypothetical protein